MRKIIFYTCWLCILCLPSCTGDLFVNNTGPEHLLSGTIYRDCNKNTVLANAEVYLWDDGKNYEHASAMTDENGYFELRYNAQTPAIESFLELRTRHTLTFGTVAVLPTAQSFENYDFIDNDLGKVQVNLDFQGTYSENDTLYYAVADNVKGYEAGIALHIVIGNFSKGNLSTHEIAMDSWGGGIFPIEAKLIWGIGMEEYRKILRNLSDDTPSKHKLFFTIHGCGVTDEVTIDLEAPE